MSSGAVLVARAVSFAYPNGVEVVAEWDASFERGSVTALTGPSGAGKSTLLYLLGLMHRQTGGEIEVDGSATSVLADRARALLRAHRFGFVFQDAALDPTRTVLDNVVETAEQVAWLHKRGVQYCQGWHFAKAMPPHEFMAWQQQPIAGLVARPVS